MFVRIGLVIVGLALLAALFFGIGIGLGVVHITADGIAFGRESETPDAAPASAPGNTNTLSLEEQQRLNEARSKELPPGVPEAPKPAPPVVAQASGAGAKPDVALAAPKSDGVIRIAAGSTKSLTDPDGKVWEAASGFADGEVVDRSNVTVSNSRFQELFRNERFKFTAWQREMPNGAYTVRLHFAETGGMVTGPGQRTFAIVSQGELVKQFDIFAEARGARLEVVKNLNVRVTDGTLTIKFIGAKRSFPILNGIEVIPNGPAEVSVPARGDGRAFALRINAGSTAAVRDPDGNTWFADTGFEGGETADRGRAYIANTAFPDIYRTERYGMTVWRRELPNGSYTVKLHFAETADSVHGAGNRVVNIIVQDQVLRDFDVYKEAGGKFKALIKEFKVDITDGRLVIRFQPTARDKNVPEINGIEVIRR